jgi:hypothetical protein
MSTAMATEARLRQSQRRVALAEFEDNLWVAVVREHGDELERPVHRHRRATRAELLAGTTVGVAAVATTAALLLGASTSPPAFAVTRNPNGTVTVNLMKLSGISGANDKLAAMGVRAQIVPPAKEAPKLVCPGGTAPTITLDPASIANPQGLVITPGQPSAREAPPVKTNSTSGDNHVVRTLSPGGKLRTSADSADNHVVRMYCP